MPEKLIPWLQVAPAGPHRSAAGTARNLARRCALVTNSLCRGKKRSILRGETPKIANSG
jgi:hypothetical protein